MPLELRPAPLIPVPPRFSRTAVWPAAGRERVVRAMLVPETGAIWWPIMLRMPPLRLRMVLTVAVVLAALLITMSALMLAVPPLMVKVPLAKVT